MECGIMAQGMTLNDARLLIDVLGNERILGEYTPDELMRLAIIKHGLATRVRQAERRNREAAEMGELV